MERQTDRQTDGRRDRNVIAVSRSALMRDRMMHSTCT